MAQLLYNKPFIDIDLSDLDSLVENFLATKDIKNLYLILPTGKQVRRTKRKIIDLNFRKFGSATSSLNVFTFKDFATEIFSDINGGRNFRFISDAYRLALFEEAVYEADLEFFIKPGANIGAGTLQKLADVIFGLREDGMFAENLSEEAERLSEVAGDSLKIRDIRKLSESYENLLEDPLNDYPKALRNMISEFETAPQGELIRKAFPGREKPTVFFSGFTEFNLPETQFLTLLYQEVIPVGISVDYSPVNGPLFGNFEENIEKLKDGNYLLRSLDSFPDASRKGYEPMEIESVSEFLRAYLFNQKFDKNNSELSKVVRVLAAEDRDDEVNSVLKLIKFLNIYKKIPLSEICVVFRSPGDYPGLFREAFSSAGAPVNVSDRHNLASSPVTSAILDILNIGLNNFSREDVRKALRNAFVDFKRNEDDDFDAPGLIKAAANRKIIGGFKRGGAKDWLSSFETAIRFYRNRLSNAYEDDEQDSTADFEAKLAEMERAERDFRYLMKKIFWKNEKFSVSEFRKLVLEIIDEFKIKERVLSRFEILNAEREKLNRFEFASRIEESERDAKAFSSLIQTLEEFTQIMTERKGDEKFPLRELTQKFKTTTLGAKYQIKEKEGYGVDVTSVEQIRGIPYKATILCGALDGSFPLAYRPETFLGRHLKETENRHIKSERTLFYQFLTNNPDALNSADKSVYIFYPKTANGRESVRSTFTDALLNVIDAEPEDIVFDLSEIKEKLKTGDPVTANEREFQWIYSLYRPAQTLELFAQSDTSLTPVYPASDEISDMSDLKYLIAKNRIRKTPDGVLDIDTAANYTVEFLKNKTDGAFSASDFDTYADCAYKYFARKIIRIEEPEKFELAVTPLDRGSLIHRILYIFYTRRVREAIDSGEAETVAVTPDGEPVITVELSGLMYSFYENELINIAESVIEEIEFAHPFFDMEKKAIIGDKNRPGVLKNWLRREIENMSESRTFRPSLFEIGFGMPKKYGSVTEEPVRINEKLQIRGKIDRIEFGVNEGELDFMIADYKTGRSDPASNTDVKTGKRFQIPLYIVAAKKLLSDVLGFEARPAGGVFYMLYPKYDEQSDRLNSNFLSLVPQTSPLVNKSNERKHTQVLKKDEAIKDVLNLSIDYAGQIVEKIGRGDFTPDYLLEKTCDYCAFASICRKATLKLIK